MPRRFPFKAPLLVQSSPAARWLVSRLAFDAISEDLPRPPIEVEVLGTGRIRLAPLLYTVFRDGLCDCDQFALRDVALGDKSVGT